MHLHLFPTLALVALTLAQAPTPSGRPAPAPPAGAFPGPAPLAPAAPAGPAPAVNPIVSMIQSGIKDPAFTPSPVNPIISLIQSGLKNPAFTPTTTYTKEPTSFAPSNIEFGTTLVQAPKPKPTINPTAPDSTPGEVRFCTSTTYTSPSGDSADSICDAVHSTLNTCRNLSAALRNKVVSVTPDKGQLCLLFADEDCYGAAEWVKWPGVQNLRGRLGEGGGWAGRVVSFRCMRED